MDLPNRSGERLTHRVSRVRRPMKVSIDFRFADLRQPRRGRSRLSAEPRAAAVAVYLRNGHSSVPMNDSTRFFEVLQLKKFTNPTS